MTRSVEENKIEFYKLLVDQIQKYNTILWQFPTAFSLGNLLAVTKQTSPWIILSVSIIDLTLAYGFHNILRTQGYIIDASRKAEIKLGNTGYEDFLPVFIRPCISARTILELGVWGFSIILFIYSIIQTGLLTNHISIYLSVSSINK